MGIGAAEKFAILQRENPMLCENCQWPLSRAEQLLGIKTHQTCMLHTHKFHYTLVSTTRITATCSCGYSEERTVDLPTMMNQTALMSTFLTAPAIELGIYSDPDEAWSGDVQPLGINGCIREAIEPFMDK